MEICVPQGGASLLWRVPGMGRARLRFPGFEGLPGALHPHPAPSPTTPLGGLPNTSVPSLAVL